jgi:dienelactone hydrolase
MESGQAVRHEVRVTRAVVYGHAVVQIHTGRRTRPLLLDRYEPVIEVAPGERRPVFVMAFGGAFHRGDRQADEFGEGEHTNTPVSAYCRSFASRGWVACSIDYRLVQEDPDPGTTPVIASPSRVPMSRVSRVREMLGLSPASAETVCATIEAATDDMAAAVRFVRAHAEEWAIDPAAMVIGGFSAGARIALGAAYGERVGVAGVVALSGYLANDDLERCVKGTVDEPPALLIYGDNDLDYIVQQTPVMSRRFASAGRGSETWKVQNATHFYPACSSAVREDGRITTVEEAIAAFLSRVVASARQPPGAGPQCSWSCSPSPASS